MKTLLSLFIVCISLLSYGQDLNKEWSSNKVVWNESELSYSLNNLNENNKEYGYFIGFKKDKTFISYYSAPCGNDCFRLSKGTYKLIGKNKIRLIIKEIEQNGDCDNLHKKGSWDLGIYTIKNTEKGIDLIKSK